LTLKQFDMNIGDKAPEIYSAAQLTEFIHEVGFLPLLDSGIPGFAAEDIVTDDCRYVVFPDGGWGWSLLTTPEALMGRDVFRCPRTPQESYERLLTHFRALLPEASDKQIQRLVG
jgi:hypothetical protein